MKAFLVIKNKWTGAEYIYPKIFTNEAELKSFVDGWDKTNTSVTIHHLSEEVAHTEFK